MIDYSLETPTLPETVKSEPQTADWLADTTVVTTPDRWFLCSMSEEYLDQAFDNGNTVTVVNDALVVKPVGKLAGLCIADVKGPNGGVLFKKGYWYCPVGECRDDLTDNFGINHKTADRVGNTRMSLTTSQWALMRIAKPSNGQTIDEYVQAISVRVSALQPTFNVTPVMQEPMPGLYEPVNPPITQNIPFRPFDTQSYLRDHALGMFDMETFIDVGRIRERIQSPRLEQNFAREIREISLNSISLITRPSEVKNYIKLEKSKINNLEESKKYSFFSKKENLENIIRWEIAPDSE